MSAWLAGSAPTWIDGLWRASWQGAVAILLAWGICRSFPRISVSLRSALWRIACLKLLLGLLWVSPLTIPALPPRTETAGTILPDAGRSAALPPSAPRPAPNALGGNRPVSSVPPARVKSGFPSPLPPASSPLAPALLLVWLTGVAWGAAHTAAQFRGMKRLRKSSLPIGEGEIREEARRIAGRLGLKRMPSLLKSGSLTGPLITGIFRPAILLPEDVEAALSPEERRMALAHEMIHLRRRDLLWAWVPRVTQILFFFHPLAWLACREWQVSTEASCDAETLRVTQATPPAYGRLLLKFVSTERPAMAGGLGAGVHSIKERLAALSKVSTPSKRAVLIGLFSALVFAALTIPPWTLTRKSAEPMKRSPLLRQMIGALQSGDELKAQILATSTLPQDARICVQHLKRIGKALDAYRKDHGDLPAHLSDLYPRYVKDKAVFRCPLDSTPGTAGFYGVDGVGGGAIRSSYLYERTTDRMGRLNYVWLGTQVRGYDATPQASWRETRTAQSLHFGDLTPVLRCYHHLARKYPGDAPHKSNFALTLAANGSVYPSGDQWECDPSSLRVALERMNRDLNASLDVFNRNWLLYHLSNYFSGVSEFGGQRLGRPLKRSLHTTAMRLARMEKQFPADLQKNRMTNLRSDLWSAVGSLRMAAGDTDGAIDAYEASMELPGNHDMVEPALVALYSRTGNSRRGINFFKNRMKNARFFDSAEERMLEVMRGAGRWREALSYLEAKLSREPERPGSSIDQMRLMEIYRSSHRLGDEIRKLEAELAKEPNDRDLRDRLAWAYRAAGQPEKAQALLWRSRR